MSLKLPTPVMRIVLGRELARQRRQANLTQVDAANVLGCTQQKIAFIENGGGVRPIRPRDLAMLLDSYGAGETDRAYARDLHAESGRSSKPGGFRSRFRQHMRLLVDMEPTCQRYESYRSMVVPGLLQTEDYMRALFRAWRPSPTPDEIDRDTSDRLARQGVLDSTEQNFWFIVDEAALRRGAGDRDVMKGQVGKLVEAIDRPNVEVQIVPFDIGYYMGQSHDYTIFGYETEPAVGIVYVEQHDGGEYIDEDQRTLRYLTLWEQQRAAASGPEQTRLRLLQMIKEL